MNRKPLTFCLTLILVLLLAVCGAQAKNGTGTGSSGDSGPPTEPTVDIKYIWMTGTVDLVEVYELKETLIVYDYDDNVWVEKLVPIDEPDLLYFLTVVGDQDVDGDGDGVTDFELKDGDQWLLDFGPEWYAADPCLIDSYICPENNDIELKMGPFVLGIFTCLGDIVEGVVSNDPAQAADTIPLMSRTRRDALSDAASVYAFGRSGGSEIVWIWDDPTDDTVEFVRYPKAGSNIIWEIDDGSGQAWWRGEAPPQAMTSELSCTTTTTTE